MSARASPLSSPLTLGPKAPIHFSARVVQLVVVFGVWSAFAAFELTRDCCQSLASGGAGLSAREVAASLETMWLWAAFTPAIFALAERYPIERTRAVRRVALHAALAVAFAVLDVVVDEAYLRLVGPSVHRPLWARFVAESFINLYSYFAVLGVGLALRFHRLLGERHLRVARLETSLVEAQLGALEEKLRPHFLYNTLHTIGSLVRAQRSQDAVRMIALLGDLLRRALGAEEGHEASLESEVDFARRYLAIEGVRFGPKLRVEIDVDDAAASAQVPRFLLQPLVENAVRHGVERSSGDALVQVQATRQGDTLRIVVRDTGPGPSTIELPRAGHGIGLRATRARLAQLYGDRQSLELHPDPRGGARVQISLPFRTTRVTEAS